MGNDAGRDAGPAQRGSAAIAGLADRARRITLGVLVVAAVVCGSSWLAGVAATSGVVRMLWVIAGGLGVAIAVGAAFWSFRSLGLVIDRAAAIRQSLGALADQVSDTDLADLVSRADDEQLGVIRRARLVGRLRSAVSSTAGEFQDLSLALAALARFPAATVLASTLIVAFGALGFLFVLVLVF